MLMNADANLFCKEKVGLVLIITESALKNNNVCRKQKVITKRAGVIPLIQIHPKFHWKTSTNGIPVLMVSSSLWFQSEYLFDKGTGA